MSVEETVGQLWPGGGAVVTVLGGRITNHNFKVEVGGEAFVVRIGGKDTERLGTPFGGLKQSGFGREFGLHALDGHSEVKNVFISTEA
jgi:acyl-CoA reductase-like NAD-dependent aldehyde dehydrogenase